MARMEKRDEFLASEVRELVLEVGYAECVVVEEVTDKIIVEAAIDAENADRYYCTLTNGVLDIDAGDANKKINLIDKNRSALEKQEIRITVPCGMKLEVLELCVGAGTARLKNASSSSFGLPRILPSMATTVSALITISFSFLKGIALIQLKYSTTSAGERLSS